MIGYITTAYPSKIGKNAFVYLDNNFINIEFSPYNIEVSGEHRIHKVYVTPNNIHEILNPHDCTIDSFTYIEELVDIKEEQKVNRNWYKNKNLLDCLYKEHVKICKKDDQPYSRNDIFPIKDEYPCICDYNGIKRPPIENVKTLDFIYRCGIQDTPHPNRIRITNINHENNIINEKNELMCKKWYKGMYKYSFSNFMEAKKNDHTSTIINIKTGEELFPEYCDNIIDEYCEDYTIVNFQKEQNGGYYYNIIDENGNLMMEESIIYPIKEYGKNLFGYKTNDNDKCIQRKKYVPNIQLINCHGEHLCDYLVLDVTYIGDGKALIVKDDMDEYPLMLNVNTKEITTPTCRDYINLLKIRDY